MSEPENPNVVDRWLATEAAASPECSVVAALKAATKSMKLDEGEALTRLRRTLIRNRHRSQKMSKVKRIQVAGFRGILSRLQILLNGKSMILYGRNGTGKSSLTDAWEWLISSKVAHLAREGAEESSYPHMNAPAGGTYTLRLNSWTRALAPSA